MSGHAPYAGPMDQPVRRMFSILEAGRRFMAEMPWIRANPEEFQRRANLSPHTLRFSIHENDNLVAEGLIDPEYRFSADLEGKKPGVYTVEITGRDEDGARQSFWKQHVYIQTSKRRTPERIEELASRYAPVFLFSRKEKYFPVSFAELLKSRSILETDQCVEVKTFMGSEQIAISRLDEFLRYNGNSEYLLDQSVLDMDDSVFVKIQGDFRSSVVYYSYIEDRNSERFFINYHTFYAFDPKTGIAKMLNIGPHIFDRESLTIAFNGDEKPETLVLSGHLENQPILFLNNLKMWSTGRVRLRFPDTDSPAVQEHPIVPVAEGSHALYPTPGLYHISVLAEFAGHIFQNIFPRDLFEHDEEQPPEMDSHQVLLPPSLASDRFVNYELRPLRLDMLRSEPPPPMPLYDPATACLVFSGYWVDVPGFQNERFPPFSKKEKDIEEWVDKAYFWDWHDLPEAIVKHNRALSEYLAKNTRPVS